jgi:hypothetical protein
MGKWLDWWIFTMENYGKPTENPGKNWISSRTN